LGLEINALTRRGKNYEAELKKIQGIETEMDKKYEDHWNQIRAVMRPEQQASFDCYGGLGLGMGPGMRYGRGYFCPWRCR